MREILFFAAICRRCRQHLAELVSQSETAPSAHAQLPIPQEEPEEQEIVAEDLEQPAQEQVRAYIIMSQMKNV